jgi:O-antigen/teichoic acid export membrane protein
MKREFLLNLIFLFAINLIIKPLYIFGIDRNIQNTVGDNYGIYFALLSYTYLFQMINDLGLQNFTARTISINPSQINNYFAAILKLKLILGVLFAVIIWVGAWILGYNLHYQYLLIWLICIQILTSGVLYLRANIAGLGFYRFDSFLSILDKSLLILVLGFILIQPTLKESFKIEWFLYAQTGSVLITFCIALTYILRKHTLKWENSGVKKIIKIIGESYPFALITILMMIYSRIDAVMLERMGDEGIRESFLYASAYRLLDAANMFSYLFIGLLLPMFSRLIGLGEALDALFDVGLRLMMIAATCVAIPLLFYNTQIMSWLYTFGDGYSGTLLGLLMFGYVFMSAAQIFGAVLIAKGTIRVLNWVFVIGIVINVGLNIVLIPSLQAKGAAISTVITEVYVMLAMGIILNKVMPEIWRKRSSVKLLLYIPICCLGVFTIMTYLPSIPFWGYLFSVTLCFGLAFILRIIPVKSTLIVLFANKQIQNNPPKP